MTDDDDDDVFAGGVREAVEQLRSIGIEPKVNELLGLTELRTESGIVYSVSIRWWQGHWYASPNSCDIVVDHFVHVSSDPKIALDQLLETLEAYERDKQKEALYE